MEDRDPFQRPIHRRFLTADECRRFDLPLGSEARCDEGGNISEPYQLRMSCLAMAQERPDGAALAPLEEVMERAERYWRFVISGMAKPQQKISTD